jgi:hypothetical protein
MQSRSGTPDDWRLTLASKRNSRFCETVWSLSISSIRHPDTADAKPFRDSRRLEKSLLLAWAKPGIPAKILPDCFSTSSIVKESRISCRCRCRSIRSRSFRTSRMRCFGSVWCQSAGARSHDYAGRIVIEITTFFACLSFVIYGALASVTVLGQGASF